MVLHKIVLLSLFWGLLLLIIRDGTIWCNQNTCCGIHLASRVSYCRVEFASDNTPLVVTHMFVVFILAAYTLFRFYRFRNTIENKESLNYKRLVWTILYHYLEGAVLAVIYAMMFFLLEVYILVRGEVAGETYWNASIQSFDGGLVSFFSSIVQVKLWIPNSRHQEGDIELVKHV